MWTWFSFQRSEVKDAVARIRSQGGTHGDSRKTSNSRAGEIVLFEFPSTKGSGSKVRPVVMLHDFVSGGYSGDLMVDCLNH